jgi:hypothetical protein
MGGPSRKRRKTDKRRPKKRRSSYRSWQSYCALLVRSRWLVGVAGAELKGASDSSSAGARRDRFPLEPSHAMPQQNGKPSFHLLCPSRPPKITQSYLAEPHALASGCWPTKGWLGQSRMGASTQVQLGHRETVFDWNQLTRCPSGKANHLSTCYAPATHSKSRKIIYVSRTR